MVRPPISWRTLAVFDFMRVPPPAASTITVRSPPMGTNLIPETGAFVIVREDDPVGCPGQGPAEAHSPVGRPGRTCRPAGRAPTLLGFPGWSAGPDVPPRRAGLTLPAFPGWSAGPDVPPRRAGPYPFGIPRLV